MIDPATADAVRFQILTRFPSASAEAQARADRILIGLYDLLGYRGLQFPDWHSDPVHHRSAPRTCWADIPYLDPTVGDHKIIWELNRHQHWMQLGRALWLTKDLTYGQAILEQFQSWLEDNPPLTGINWASMLEIGLRSISWTMAVHFLAGCGLELPDYMFGAIERQLSHLEHHLSYYFSPNTHLTGEALALYVVGYAFPELPSHERWITTGRAVLLQEIERQILADGGHAERSMHYQRYTLDFYLLALRTARRVDDVLATPVFADAATRLAEFTAAIADGDGRLPLIGDDDGGVLWPLTGRSCNDVRDSLAIAAVTLDRPDLAPWGLTEETFWVAASEATEWANHTSRFAPGAASRTSITLPDSGYVVLRGFDGDHAVIDAGPHGYMNGGHAHADALSLTLRIGKRTLLVDPGTSTYTMDPRLRDRLRSSFNHNTVSVDGRPQSTPAGPFRWKSAAHGRVVAARHGGPFDWVETVHDGYSPIEHRRSVIRVDRAGWLVVDELRGPGHGDHAAAAHWQFDPAWMVRSDGYGRLRATHFEGDVAWLLFDEGDLSLLHGDDDTGLGWYAPVYGTLVPTWSARITRTSACPLSMVTWIGESASPHGPVLQRLHSTADPGADAIAARVVDGENASTFLLRPGESSVRDGRADGFDQYQTDARVMHVRLRRGRIVAMDLVDASHALARRDGFITIAADEPIPFLHASITNGLLHLATSAPPRQLRVEGTRGALVISAGNWTCSPSWPLFHFGAPFALHEIAPERCEEYLPLRESSW